MSSFCRAIEHRPELASLARTFAYVASEPDAAADGDEIDFLAGRLRHLDSLKLRGDITSPSDLCNAPDRPKGLTKRPRFGRHLVQPLAGSVVEPDEPRLVVRPGSVDPPPRLGPAAPKPRPAPTGSPDRPGSRDGPAARRRGRRPAIIAQVSDPLQTQHGRSVASLSF